MIKKDELVRELKYEEAIKVRDEQWRLTASLPKLDDMKILYDKLNNEK